MAFTMFVPSPEEFAAYVREQYAKMGKLVKDAGVRAE